MRSRLPLPLAALCLAAAACSSREFDIQCKLPPPDESVQPGAGDAPEDPLAALARRGAEEARADIAAGRPRLRFAGLPDFRRGNLDPETGILLANTGCSVSAELMAESDAYNETIRAALRAGELEGMTFRHKVTDRETLDRLFAASAGTPLAVDEGEAASPDGRFVVDEALREGTPYLWVTDRERGSRTPLMLVRDRCRLLFDHGGTTLYVRDEGYRCTMTFDLPTGAFLQGFEDRD